jgi:hypothetical protein
MDGALQAVDGLALVEQIEDFRPENRVAEVYPAQVRTRN